MLTGDCVAVLPTLAAESIDACITDPPYELAFMGQRWDASGIAFSVGTWRAVYRVLKPGAYLLAFGGTRTSHRMVCAIEDAGFEIRDALVWLYGSGFPKSLDVGDGRGTALKPAHEPIALARKPFKGTVAANIARHGTGGLNVDACRIATGDDRSRQRGTFPHSDDAWGNGHQPTSDNHPLGRWPANVCLDEDAAAALDEQTGDLVAGVAVGGKGNASSIFGTPTARRDDAPDTGFGDSGGASRFFYVAKPSREERDYGCDRLPVQSPAHLTGRKEGSAGLQHGRAGTDRAARNYHPTVKPIALLRWLVKLITPPGGTVIDPFAGSGSTGMACRYEQRSFIGIEQNPAYVVIADARIAAVAPLFGDAP